MKTERVRLGTWIPRLGESVIQVDLTPLSIDSIEVTDTEQYGTVKLISGIISISSKKYEWDAFSEDNTACWTICGDGYGADYQNAWDQSIIESEIRNFLDLTEI